jgi:hypothetical protein
LHFDGTLDAFVTKCRGSGCSTISISLDPLWHALPRRACLESEIGTSMERASVSFTPQEIDESYERSFHRPSSPVSIVQDGRNVRPVAESRIQVNCEGLRPGDSFTASISAPLPARPRFPAAIGSMRR